MMPYGNVFQGNLGRQPSGKAMGGSGSFYGASGPRMSDDSGFNFDHLRPQRDMGDDIRRPPSNPARPPIPPAPPPGRIMDGPGSGFTFPGNSGVSPFTPGRAQPIQEPSQGTPYGGPQQPGRVMDGPGSFYGPAGPRMADETGFNYQDPRQPRQRDMGDDIRRVPDNRPAPPYGQSDTSWQPSPGDYRRSVMADQARATRQASESDAKRQKAQQNRPTYNVPGYDNRVIDPMVAQNEYDRIAREQRAAARGDKPRKTQMELDMEMRNQEHNRIVQQRSQVQSALPGVDQATQNAIRQRINAYGETPEQAYQNGGFAARAAQQQQAQQRQDLLQQGAANPAGNWRMPPTFR